MSAPGGDWAAPLIRDTGPGDALARDVTHRQAGEVLARRGSIDAADVLNGLTPIKAGLDAALDNAAHFNYAHSFSLVEIAQNALEALVAKCRAAQMDARA